MAIFNSVRSYDSQKLHRGEIFLQASGGVTKKEVTAVPLCVGSHPSKITNRRIFLAPH